jgi:hypothetical protein
MPSGFTPTTANRQPVSQGDSVIFDKIFATGGIDLSGGPGSSGTLSSIVGAKREIVSAAATLTAAQSGALCVWPAAAGFTYTLPIITAANIGMWFEFLCTITNTSVACKVITGQATDLIVGGVHVGVLDTTPGANPGPKFFTFATDKVACTMGGSDTTKGGVVGTRIRLEAVALLQWAITGNIIAAGTIATPAATS